VTERQTRLGQGFVVLLGMFAFATILAARHITEGDLWAQLAIGASVWEKGKLLRHDIFAFTPTLPEWIAHEWGAGVVFYGVLKALGPAGLMWLKIILPIGALGFAFATGRRQGCETPVLLLIAMPAAACLLPGYIPVLRSHAFTFFFFGLTLYCLEQMRAGGHWAGFVLPLIIWVWTNLHGGFVAGLAMIFLYAGGAVISRKNAGTMVAVALASMAVTFINPYGIKFWQYLIPALLHPRARITEWRPLPFWGWDDWWGFRVLFVLTVAAVAIGWKSVKQKNFCGLAALVLTAYMGWHVRRHGPFLGVAALAFAGPYFAGAFSLIPPGIRERLNPLLAAGILYMAVALYVALQILPRVSLQPLAPVGEDPVRETDILSQAGAKGNLASPFAWGSYLSWRLYPNIKVSMDGRYETTYPESSFNLNAAFFEHEGDWFELCRDFKVDYVILDMQSHPLRPEDLTAKGYVLIWKEGNVSALLCLPEHADALKYAARNLPQFTIDPLDLKSRPSTLFPVAGFPP
jgi:hypothetical protein